MSFSLDATLLNALVELSAKAGRVILQAASDGFDIQTKSDDSPVTIADVRAEETILAGLRQLLPGVPVLAEESAAGGDVPVLAGTFICIDPLDGTREFVSGRPEYTVNLALVENGRPRLGILHAPALGRTYWGIEGTGAARSLHDKGATPLADSFTKIHTREAARPLVALTSRGHNSAPTEAFLDQHNVTERQRLGSAIKFGLVAEGAADLYARFTSTMEWDTAAGDAILSAAGGAVLSPDGTPLAYSKNAENFRNGPFIAWGRPPEA